MAKHWSRDGAGGVTPAELSIAGDFPNQRLYIVEAWQRAIVGMGLLPFVPGKTEYVDKRGTWVPIRSLVGKPFYRKTIEKHVKQTGLVGREVFVLKDEHDELARSRGYRYDPKRQIWTRPIAAAPRHDPRWMTQLEACEKYRISRHCLETYSTKDNPHPLLGHHIPTEWAERVVGKGHLRNRRVYWRADVKRLRELLDAGKDVRAPAGKVRLDRLAAELGANRITLTYHAQNGRFNAEKADGFRKSGILCPVWYVVRREVEDFQKNGSNKLGERGTIEHLGKPCLLLPEAAKRAGVPANSLRNGRYRNRPVAHWGGITVRAWQISVKTFRSKWKKVWVYAVDDLDRVHDYLSGNGSAVGHAHDPAIHAKLDGLHVKMDGHAVATDKQGARILKEGRARGAAAEKHFAEQPGLIESLKTTNKKPDDGKPYLPAKWFEKNTTKWGNTIRVAVSKGANIRIERFGKDNRYSFPDVEAHWKDDIMLPGKTRPS